MKALSGENERWLQQITRDNRWYARFLKAVKQNYHKSVWKRLITDCNSDIWLYGYEYARKHWSRFMDFHYSFEKEAAMTTTVQAHRQYHLMDGTRVPSVTQVLGILDKGGLAHWAWELGLQNRDYRAVRDLAGRVGTLTHALIAGSLTGATPLPNNYSPQEIAQAQKCLAKYQAWAQETPFEPIMIETPLVSEEFKYGGTPDLLAEIKGEFVLLDFKTGGAVYPTYFYQLAAYGQLLKEQGWPLSDIRIVRISPDETRYEVASSIWPDIDWQIFQHCLAIYRLQGGRGC